jgi:cation transporter-like permease
MTTAFAWFARGDLRHSWTANPAGLALAMLSALFVPWLVASAVLATPIGFRSVTTPLLGALVIAVVLSLAIWWARLIISPSSLTVPDNSSASGIGRRAWE